MDSAKSKKGVGITKAWQESYRITFYDGYAYRYDCLTMNRKGSSKNKLIEVNTSDYYNFMGVRKAGTRMEGKVLHNETEAKLGNNYFHDNIKLCNYVLSDDYKLYLAPTFVMGTKVFRYGKIPQFHSNILNDAPVRCAGTIGIVRGVVKVLTNESGHFQPNRGRLKYVIKLLKMVRMSNVDAINIRAKPYYLCILLTPGRSIPVTSKSIARHAAHKKVISRELLMMGFRYSKICLILAPPLYFFLF